jgi:hypothetical protein
MNASNGLPEPEKRLPHETEEDLAFRNLVKEQVKSCFAIIRELDQSRGNDSINPAT